MSCRPYPLAGKLPAGLVYGVLFPFQALARPLEIYGEYAGSGTGFVPGAAHTLQGRLMVRF